MKVVAYCEACRHRHNIDFDPFKQTNEFADWRTKHSGHTGVGFLWPGRSSKPSFVDYFKRAWSYLWHPSRPGLVAEPNYPGNYRHRQYRKLFGKSPFYTEGILDGLPTAGFEEWLDDIRKGRVADPEGDPDSYFTDRLPDGIAAFLHNADAKITYVASSAVAFTSTVSLASSSTKLAGAESAAVDNSTNKYLDYALAGAIKVGTTPTTAKSLDICLVGIMNDSTWPDVFDGTDSAETVTNQEIKDQICKPFQTISIISTTSDVVYNYGPGSVASRFGGQVPLKFDLFCAHDMVAALNGTQANPAHVTPSYLTIA